MKITRIIIGIAVSLILPLVGASAKAVSDPGIAQSEARADQQNAVSHAYNYGRDGRGKSGINGKAGKGGKGSKGGGKGSHGSQGGHGSKSPCKPHRGR